jgi:hypothetical protein
VQRLLKRVPPRARARGRNSRTQRADTVAACGALSPCLASTWRSRPARSAGVPGSRV